MPRPYGPVAQRLEQGTHNQKLEHLEISRERFPEIQISHSSRFTRMAPYTDTSGYNRVLDTLSDTPTASFRFEILA